MDKETLEKIGKYISEVGRDNFFREIRKKYPQRFGRKQKAKTRNVCFRFKEEEFLLFEKSAAELEMGKFEYVRFKLFGKRKDENK